MSQMQRIATRFEAAIRRAMTCGGFRCGTTSDALFRWETGDL